MPLKGHISAVPRLATRVAQFAPINAKHLAEVERLRRMILQIACFAPNAVRSLYGF